MSQASSQEEINLITLQANNLLVKLTASHILLQKLNTDIASRPFSTRIHGQFDHELKKSQSFIKKLSSLLRKYHSFEFHSNCSLELKDDNDNDNKPIDSSFIYLFKDICLKIEKEWRIGTKIINEYQIKYGLHNNNNNNINNDASYHSDNDVKYKYKKRIQNKKYKDNYKRSRRRNSFNISKSRSNSSSPMHTFSNPNSPLYSHRSSKSQSNSNTSSNMPSFKLDNTSKSQSQSLQTQKYKSKTHISDDFVPYMDEERLAKVIRDIADDLQYIMELNTQVRDLVSDQQDDIDDIEQKVQKSADNVASGTSTLMSIRKSPTTYAIMGGLTLAAIGGPALLVGVASVKAAISGALGFGTLGAFGGSWYAKKSNDNSNKEQDIHNKQMKEQLLNDNNNDNSDIIDNANANANKNKKNNNNKRKHFKTKPRKRRNYNQKKRKNIKFNMNNYNDNDDDDDDLDVWDARN